MNHYLGWTPDRVSSLLAIGTLAITIGWLFYHLSGGGRLGGMIRRAKIGGYPTRGGVRRVVRSTSPMTEYIAELRRTCFHAADRHFGKIWKCQP